MFALIRPFLLSPSFLPQSIVFRPSASFACKQLAPWQAGPIIFSTIKSFFKRLKNQYNRYPKRLFFDGGKEINNDLEN